MKSLLWFLLGITGGFVLAHLVDKDPRGHEMLAEIDSRISEFTDRMSDAYREQEAKFTGIVENAKGAASSALSAAKDAASDVVDSAQDAASHAADAAQDAASDIADDAQSAVDKPSD